VNLVVILWGQMKKSPTLFLINIKIKKVKEFLYKINFLIPIQFNNDSPRTLYQHAFNFQKIFKLAFFYTLYDF